MKQFSPLGVSGPVRLELSLMHPNQNAIFERLEVTKKFGLVSEYLVSWTGRSGRLDPKVTVWGKDGTPEDVVQHYIARLLKGLVPDRRIIVAD
jgi:hypothetical protein